MSYKVCVQEPEWKALSRLAAGYDLRTRTAAEVRAELDKILSRVLLYDQERAEGAVVDHGDPR